MSNNFNGIFTYESIYYPKNEGSSVFYVNCVMLKTAGDMEKGTHVPYITISYGLLGYDSKNNLIYDEGAIDDRTS